MTARLSYCLLLALVVFAGFSVTAQGAAPASSAQEQYRQAQALFKQGQLARALPLFRKLHAKTNSPNARLYIARCLERLGDLPEAYRQMRKTLDEARTKAAAQPRFAVTRDAAATELALLEPQVATVILVPRFQTTATVRFDGAALEPAQLGQPFVTMPGKHEVVVAAADRHDKRLQVTAKAGATTTIELSLGEAEKTTEPIEQDWLDDVRGAGIGLAALGASGMVVFAITYAIADDKLATLDEACGGKICSDPSHAQTVDDGKRAELASFVALGIGLAALSAGTVMIAVGAESTVEMSLGPGSLQLRGRF